MWSLQGIRAICLTLKTVIPTVQMLTDSFINMHFFYRQCGLQAFPLLGDHLLCVSSLNCINEPVPTRHPKFYSSPDKSSFIYFFQQKNWNAPPSMPTLLLKRIFSKLSEERCFASFIVLPQDQIILVLTPEGFMDHFSALPNTISWIITKF